MLQHPQVRNGCDFGYISEYKLNSDNSTVSAEQFYAYVSEPEFRNAAGPWFLGHRGQDSDTYIVAVLPTSAYFPTERGARGFLTLAREHAPNECETDVLKLPPEYPREDTNRIPVERIL